MHFGLHVLATLAFVGLISTPLLAQSEPLEEKRNLASSFLSEKVEVWQKRLKLDEWKITVVMARKADLKKGTMAGIRWDKGKKTATLWALDAADYTIPTDEMLKDLEFTVVHELIHLELASLPKSEASRRKEETAVNQLTEALLALDHK
jgi:hypothetical protein